MECIKYTNIFMYVIPLVDSATAGTVELGTKMDIYIEL